jgi:hypothetical protein
VHGLRRALPTPAALTAAQSLWQACAAAEAAYARALSSVAKLSLCSEADGPSLRAALEQFSDLPMMVGTAHSSVSGWKVVFLLGGGDQSMLVREGTCSGIGE